jgi:hypothetical protein
MQHDRLDRNPSLSRRLQGLPEEPQPYGFAEFQRRAREAGGRRRRPSLLAKVFSLNLSGSVAATAAAVLLAVIGVSLWSPGGLTRLASDLLAHQVPPEAATTETAAAQRGEPQAEAMEGWLASLPDDPAVVRVGTYAAVTSLEDRIALLDDEISAERAARAHPAHLQDIEQQRSQLLSSLVQVRYAETLVAASH